MLILSANDQQKLIEMPEVIDAVSIALEEYSAMRTETPVRTVLNVEKAGGHAIFMPSVAENAGSLGMKYVGSFPNNKQIGKAAINGVVLLADVQTGEPQALLEGSYLTVMRTGALSGAATKYLARENSKVLAVIGTGAQAIGQCEAIMAVRNIEKINLYNRSEKKAYDLAKQLRARFDVEVIVCQDADRAIDGADILVTATSSTTPVFSSRLAPGVHVNAIGSYQPTMQELPTHVVSSADKVVVESAEAALEEAGCLYIPIQEGEFTPSRIHSELGFIVSDEAAGRESDEELTVFKSVGFAAADIVVAKYFYEKALRENIGQRIMM
ncbi:ornithine cyclodeaminase family protein [Siminovitchia acidinfaciens]|uniref:Delta(1)-pyrroline-2-carboxylate reductase n=1 Tax=Siminovitchia acidinfaciens TaxID=2321395 RepID=A0A429Y7P6_9BACI|nr:ornithine cyclodeaminase family protein [Siminovitchia acidinfaciens]RST77422.1 ornithine cyclodeaminase family protein [Siminovitchia acidinfaciens]